MKGVLSRKKQVLPYLLELIRSVVYLASAAPFPEQEQVLAIALLLR